MARGCVERVWFGSGLVPLALRHMAPGCGGAGAWGGPWVFVAPETPFLEPSWKHPAFSGAGERKPETSRI